MVALNSSDPIFKEARDLHFNAVGLFLTSKVCCNAHIWSDCNVLCPYMANTTPPLQARQISAAYDEKKDAKSLSQLKSFVGKLPHIQAEKRALEIQTSIAALVSVKWGRGRGSVIRVIGLH